MISRLSSWRRFLPIVFLLAGGVGLRGKNIDRALPPHSDLSQFPVLIANRWGKDLQMPPEMLNSLGAGEFLIRDYLSDSGQPPLNVYVAFFPSQRSGDTIHSPKNCIPGNGWTPVESGYVSLTRPDGSAISVNRYLISKGSERAVVLYWYQAHGRITPSEYAAKIYLVADAIRLGRTDGALVRVITPIVSADDARAAQTRALDFVTQILPRLDAYIPR
jgi:EpsI family protein